MIERVFDRLDGARQIMRRCAAELTPSLLASEQAASLVEAFAEIERLAGVCRALAAQRVADSMLWRRDGDRSVAHWLARRTGSSLHRAEEEMSSVAKASALPATEAAMRAGALSLAQAGHVTRAATVDPAAEQDLLAMADDRSSMAELARAADRREAAARDDASERYVRVRRLRFLRHHYDSSGAFRAELSTTPDDGARLLAGLRPWMRARVRRAHHAAEDVPVRALLVDALIDAVSAGAGSSLASSPIADRGGTTPDGGKERAGPGSGRDLAADPMVRRLRQDRDVKVIVRVDHSALVRGHPHPGETCEVTGVGPLSPTRVRQMIDGGAFVAAVFSIAKEVVGVAHLGRGTTAAQETALQWRDAECCVTGCAANGYLETDHRTGWAITGRTQVDDLDRLCSYHHGLKTKHGYRLAEVNGKRQMRAPPRPVRPP